MPLEEMMWVEKYRPKKLEDLVNQASMKERLTPLLERKGELPHLLFAGPPGSGKTTTALISVKEILGDLSSDYTLSLNASDERGIDMVRERVKNFARYSDRRDGVPFRLIILDEADSMTADAQTALRRIMEESSQFTRFILICNYSSGIIEPLQSRCAIFRFQRLDEGSVTTHLKEIAKKEKIKPLEPRVLSSIYESTNGDLRQAINLFQAASASGELSLEKVKAVTGATVKGRVGDIVRLALDGEFENARLKMVELTRVYGIPERDFLKFANEELTNQKGDGLGDAIKILAEYDYRLVMGAQPELQLTAMLAELSALKGRKGEGAAGGPHSPKRDQGHRAAGASSLREDTGGVLRGRRPLQLQDDGARPNRVPLHSKREEWGGGCEADLLLQGQAGARRWAAIRPHRGSDSVRIIQERPEATDKTRLLRRRLEIRGAPVR